MQISRDEDRDRLDADHDHRALVHYRLCVDRDHRVSVRDRLDVVRDRRRLHRHRRRGRQPVPDRIRRVPSSPLCVKA